jgi:hypothetical protein
MINKIRIALYLTTGLLSYANTGYSLPVFDNEFACTQANKAEQYIRDFKIDVQSFGGKELCNAAIDSKKLFNDFQIIEEGRFTPQGSNNLIRNIIEPSQYYSWLRSQTEGVERGNDIPYATAYNSNGYFTMQDGWAILSTLGRVGVVIHEARHTEGYRHIPCTQGPYQGISMAGCDSTYEYSGSHAVEMEYYARVVTQGENFHPLYKKMARLMALGRTNFVFNKQVIQAREALFLINAANNEAVLVDGSKTYSREVAGQGILKRSSFGPTLLTTTRAWALDAYEWLGDIRPTEDGYSYFKLITTPNKNLPADFSIVDFEEFDIGTKRFSITLDTKGRFTQFNFQQGRWENVKTNSFNPKGFKTRLWNNQKGIFGINEQNQVARYSESSQNFQAEKLGTWPANVVSYLENPETKELLQLTTDGDLRTANGEIWSKTQGQKFSQGVNIPLYNAFEVKTAGN